MLVSKLIMCTCVVALVFTSARADLDQDAMSRPWASGVSQARQVRALQLHAEGNAEFLDSRFAKALAKYREAIKHWDHPAIRFNMAVSLINLDRLVEARDDLEQALAYDAAPLGDGVYRQALTYRKLLDAQLVKLTVICKEQSAEVTIDGKYLFTEPGAAVRYLLPGDHQIV